MTFSARQLRRSITRRHRAGSVIVLVIWAVAISAVLIAAAQILAFRQAAMGREAMARVEARWAARAGASAPSNWHSNRRAS